MAKIMESNNLIPCWSEFAQIKTVINAEKGDALKTLEKAGKLKVTLKEANHFINVDFIVPPLYP